MFLVFSKTCLNEMKKIDFLGETFWISWLLFLDFSVYLFVCLDGFFGFLTLMHLTGHEPELPKGTKDQVKRA